MQLYKELPLVSIIIPTYNRAELLSRAIESALNQTYKNIEIIIVNDGSKDNTDNIIKKYLFLHKNIKYIKHDISLGGNAARNSGILASKGQYIAGLDDDDEFLPNRITMLMKNYNDKYSMVTSRSIEINKYGQNKTKYLPIVDLNTILYFNVIGNQVLVKKERLLNVGLYDPLLSRCQDYDMWIRLIKKFGTAKIINEVTQVIYADHNGISNGQKIKKYYGSAKFYIKHKEIMNCRQRIVHLFNIKKYRSKRNYLAQFEGIFMKVFININIIYSINSKLMSYLSSTFFLKKNNI